MQHQTPTCTYDHMISYANATICASMQTYINLNYAYAHSPVVKWNLKHTNFRGVPWCSLKNTMQLVTPVAALATKKMHPMNLWGFQREAASRKLKCAASRYHKQPTTSSNFGRTTFRITLAQPRNLHANLRVFRVLNSIP